MTANRKLGRALNAITNMQTTAMHVVDCLYLGGDPRAVSNQGRLTRLRVQRLFQAEVLHLIRIQAICAKFG